MNQPRPLLLVFGASASIANDTLPKLEKSFEIAFVSRQLNDHQSIKSFAVRSYSDEDLQEVLSYAHSFNRIVVVIFNGISEKSAFFKLNNDEIEAVVHINLLLPLRITNLILKKFITKSLSFVYCASSRALTGDRGISVYSATKSGLLSFSRCMALEYGKFNKTFTVLSLGLFSGGLNNQVSEGNKAALFRRAALPSYVCGEDLARAIEFSAFNNSINGSVIKLDNGYV
jgi:3-oxoacyl-[acyl-carrier protein] reductase